MDLFTNKIFLAPMAGITDQVFRSICKEMGADVVVSEMVSAESVKYNKQGVATLAAFNESERPIGIQLFGSHPGRLAEAAQYIEQTFQPDFIDLNSGCPVPKVVKKNGGSALLKDPQLFSQILTAMVKAISIPVTVKIRSGWLKHQWVDCEIAKIAEEAGVSAIAVHPRSKTMAFTGHSFWERIARVKESVSIPVIGNGDIITPQDGKAMMEQTGCDSIMIGRSVYGNPWIFKQLKEYLKNSTITPISWSERKRVALHHFQEYRRVHGDTLAAAEMKKHVAWYAKGIPGASTFRNQVFRSQTADQIEKRIEDFFVVGIDRSELGDSDLE